MTVKVTSVRPAPPHTPSRLVLLHSRRAGSRWNRRLAWRASFIGTLLGGAGGLLAVLVLLRTTPVDALITYAAAGYAAGTVAGAVAGLVLGATAGAVGAEVARWRKRRRVEHPRRLWVRHHSA